MEKWLIQDVVGPFSFEAFWLCVRLDNLCQNVLKDTLVNALTSIAASSAIQCLELLLYH